MHLMATLALALVSLAAPAAAVSGANALTPGDCDRLAHGESIVFKQALRRGDRRYVGGVAYALVDASADDLAKLLASPDGWRRVLPETRSVRWMGSDAGDRLVEMTHGTPFLHATYSLRVRRTGRLMRFWMDPTRPHDIEDVWGFVRAEPAAGGRTLIVYGVLIDMGPGLLRDLFEDTVRDAALSVPQRVRGWLFERSAEGRRASR